MTDTPAPTTPRAVVHAALTMSGMSTMQADARIAALIEAEARSTPAKVLDCGICGKHVMEAVCLDCYERNLDGG